MKSGNLDVCNNALKITEFPQDISKYRLIYNMEKSKKEEFSNLNLVSIHEAGHALIYHLLGYRIDSCGVFEDGSGIIKCKVLIPNTEDLCWNFMLNYGMICLSGYMAELKLQKRRTNGILRVKPKDGKNIDYDSDMECLKRMLESKYSFYDYDDDIDFDIYVIQMETLKIMRKKKHWNAILSLAESLEENGFLDGETIHHILEKFVAFGTLEPRI
jgi:hypothetical protein